MMSEQDARVPKTVFVGVFFVSFSLLILELVLTRIFSVIWFYHFAFMAISLALFGLGAGGIYVHVFFQKTAVNQTEKRLFRYSLLFACSLPVSLAVIIAMSYIAAEHPQITDLLYFFVVYVAAAIPFFLGGLNLSLVMSAHKREIGRLYFADLVGGGLGCLLVVPLLGVLSAPSLVILTGAFACIAGTCFVWSAGGRLKRLVPILLGLFLAVFSVFNTVRPVFEVNVSNRTVQKPLYKLWTPLCQLAVTRFPLFAWGFSETYEGELPKSLLISIDYCAGTPMIKFDGDMSEQEHLQYDITTVPFYVKDYDNVLIIGPGGGRDVLTALYFGVERIVGVEINRGMIQLANDIYGDFIGHIYDYPQVSVFIDEGRSFIRRSDEKFDLIQASMVDTFAATAAGAFVLAENNLYTIEAFGEYINHLSEDGIISFSRWYHRELPAETLRLANLGMAALEEHGVTSPSEHVAIVKKDFWQMQDISVDSANPDGIATLLVKKSPFTAEELQRLKAKCEFMKFDLVLSPDTPAEGAFAQLKDSEGRRDLIENYPLNISPPVDDRPFFFLMMRFRDLFRALVKPSSFEQGVMTVNLKAIQVLVEVLAMVVILCALFIFGPLIWHSRRQRRETPILAKGRFLTYFTFLGLGFMLVEIPLLQRYVLFLGHPLTALSVVLSSLLVASGLGSLTTRKFAYSAKMSSIRKTLLIVLICLFVVLVLYIWPVNKLNHFLLLAPFPLRVLLTVLCLFPLGFIMGMPFPLGVSLIREKDRSLVPWIWGVNGAMSVMGSVLALCFSVGLGFTRTMIIGQMVYLAAFCMVLSFPMRKTTEE